MIVMAEICSKKKGFTLVEILIVLGIVSLLSFLAVNGYISYRKSTLLDFAADNLISQINEMKSRAMHGGGDSVKFEEIKAELSGGEVLSGEVESVSSQCYGIYFEKSGDVFVAKSFTQPFVNKKEWDVVAGKWNYRGCGDFAPGAGDIILEKDSQVNIIEIDDSAVVGNFVIRFVPPNGEVEVSEDAQPFIADFVKIKMQYGLDVDPQYQREIILDL